MAGSITPEVNVTIPRWTPPAEITLQEEVLLARLIRVRKLFSFLRLHRSDLFDDAFQDELIGMYRTSGAGKKPVAPALLAMASILQGYMGVSDAEAVELTIVDLRWQLVLDRLGATEAAFSQGALQAFRERLIEHDMDRRLLERTREFARRHGGFDWKKLPKDLRLAVDSAPFEGASRVEDTINLLGHAARNVVQISAALLKQPPAEVAIAAGIPLINSTSIKGGLDVDWTDKAAGTVAVNELVSQLDCLQAWISNQVAWLAEAKVPAIETLDEIRHQGIEQDPVDPEWVRIPRGVPKDRRISVEDGEMRHGRKSSSRLINGYKRHVGRELDTGLIWSCEVTPANAADAVALGPIEAEVKRQGSAIGELYIDRGYLSSPVVDELIENGREVICRPWVPTNRHGLFTKRDFELDLDQMTVTCPAGNVQPIQSLGSDIKFGVACETCELRDQCTKAKGRRGRAIRIAEDEPLQQRLRMYAETPEGRAKHRERVAVEHSLAHICARQGPSARYIGQRKNLYDVRRAATIQNLETMQRSLQDDCYRDAA